MNDDQRKGTLRAIFDRLFVKKQAQVDAHGYKLKHGRGLHVNRDIFTDDDLTGQKAYGAAGVSVAKGYKSEMPQTRSKTSSSRASSRNSASSSLVNFSSDAPEASVASKPRRTPRTCR